MRKQACIIFSLLLILATAGVALAHPMGNFSISHYTRFTADKETLRIRYLLDFAEIATVENMDKNSDGRVSVEEREGFLNANAAKLRDGLALSVNGTPVHLEIVQQQITPRPGAAGLETMLLTFEMTAPLPADAKDGAYQVQYRDGNFADRTGWKEIVTPANPSVVFTGSTASATDMSRELTAYPTNPTAVAPQQSEAVFTLTFGNTPVSGLPPKEAPATAGVGSSQTPKDAFTQAIATRQLTPGIVLLSLGIAFLFGAFHALSPGHGKTMVAAYLVGQRGTAKHAVFLGAVVTITHTIAVFALGLVTLLASRYVVPEKLYPVLSALSGMAIVLIGASLFRQRLAGLRHSLAHSHGQAHDHSHAPHFHEDGHDHAEAFLAHHEHEPPHGHAHEYEHEHSHDPVPPHTHEHEHDPGWHHHGDGHYHSHHPPEELPISLKTLLVLGITGGAMPCPSALVVMLSAIALHRVAFGLVLISAFSLGLATVLTGIGLLVVHARGLIERMPSSGRVMTGLPVLSAAAVTIIGLVLVVRSVMGG